ncbi:MAG: TauD/TfdA family dioxygenase [Actinomycetota bacterium]
MTVTHDQQAYNEIAVQTAARIHDVYAARRQAAEAETAAVPEPPAGKSLADLLAGSNRSALGVAEEWERMGERPVSAALQDRADAAGVTFEHLGLTLGTVLHGLDLAADLSDDTIDLIRSTLLERKVIFFRDQNLSEDTQVAFGRRFGDLDAFPFGAPGENPYILQIVHGPGSPGYENGWHTDVTWMERPSLGSIAQCVEVPPVGGDTLFADSHAAYLGLPRGLREQIDPLNAIHDYAIFIAGRGRGALPDDLVDDIKAQIPFGVSHPVVRTHPETGKPALYIHGGFIRHDSLHHHATEEPLDPDESRTIVRQLLEQHARPEYQCRFTWQPGSIAFWDNRAVQHYAVSDYYPHRRVLRRVTISGDRPVR